MWERRWLKVLLAFATGQPVVSGSWDLEVIRCDDRRPAAGWDGDDASRELLERDLARLDTTEFENRWIGHGSDRRPLISAEALVGCIDASDDAAHRRLARLRRREPRVVTRAVPAWLSLARRPPCAPLTAPVGRVAGGDRRGVVNIERTAKAIELAIETLVE